VHALADGVQHLNVDGGCTSIVAIVFELLIADDALGAFECGKSKCRAMRNSWDDGADVEGEDRGVGVDIVGEEDLGEG